MNGPRIILLAHGSRDKRWCETFEQLAAPTLKAVDNARIAYMELAHPSMDTVIAEGVAEGAKSFTIVPLFLAAGRHLRKDVPAMIEELERTLAPASIWRRRSVKIHFSDRPSGMLLCLNWSRHDPEWGA